MGPSPWVGQGELVSDLRAVYSPRDQVDDLLLALGEVVRFDGDWCNCTWAGGLHDEGGVADAAVVALEA